VDNASRAGGDNYATRGGGGGNQQEHSEMMRGKKQREQMDTMCGKRAAHCDREQQHGSSQ